MASAEPVEDFLTVDKSIPGQNYVCLSFISPEKVLKQKENLFMKEFLKHALRNKFFETPESIEKDLDEKYADFLYANEQKITEKFNEATDFQTNVRGVKVRGVYETQREAQVRAKVLQKRDKNFHVFVCQVGYWLAFNPEPDMIENQEYNNEQLNTLVGKYTENRKMEDEKYEMEVEHKKYLAKKENEEKRKELGLPEPPSNPGESSHDKIVELREIADEKDGLMADMPKETKEDKYADIWMQRQVEGTKSADANANGETLIDEDGQKSSGIDPSDGEVVSAKEVINNLF